MNAVGNVIVDIQEGLGIGIITETRSNCQWIYQLQNSIWEGEKGRREEENKRKYKAEARV